MYIAFFSDQHPGSLGGLQVSLGLQRKYLEAAVHMVTVCAPQTKRLPAPEYARDHDVFLPSREFSGNPYYLPGSRSNRVIGAAFAELPPVDLVHIQADVWGAWSGYRFARRHRLPVVHTMHSNVEVGLPASMPLARDGFRLLYALQQRHMRTGLLHDMPGYVRAFSEAADALIVPSAHFARHLHSYGVARDIQVVPTGSDDEQIHPILAEERQPRSRPVLLWPGRVSPEKRLDDTLRALALSGLDAELHVYGAGPDLSRCKTLAPDLGLGHRVKFCGTVSHDAILRAMRQADAVLQSSLGFETQGLMVYEAISLGTPVLVRDPNISRELPALSHQPVADASIWALAAGLRELPGLFTGGEAVAPRGAHSQFSQGHLTARTLEIYRRTLAEHRHGRDNVIQELSAA